VKNFIWTVGLLTTSGMALTGCQQPPRSNYVAPFPSCTTFNQVKQPAQKPLPSMQPDAERVGTVPDSGYPPLPAPTQPTIPDSVQSKQALDIRESRITETGDGSASPPSTIPSTLPAAIPGPEWSGNSVGSSPMPTPPVRTNQAFSHSDDYRVLSGLVQSWRNTWKLRYADYGAVDPFGGSVVLEGILVKSLQDGCEVRVEGRLIPPADRRSPARFEIQSIRIVGQ
jgi:hypothetical protein